MPDAGIDQGIDAGTDQGSGSFLYSSDPVAPSSGPLISRTVAGWAAEYDIPISYSLGSCTLTIISQATGQAVFGPSLGTPAADTATYHRLTWPATGALAAGDYNYVFSAFVGGSARQDAGVLRIAVASGTANGSLASFLRSEFPQIGFGSNQVLNASFPVIARPASSGQSIAWRIVGGASALTGAQATTVCRLNGSLNNVPAFTGLSAALIADEGDMVLAVLLPAALPVVVPGIASDYLFWVSVVTAQGTVITCPVLVSAVS